MAATLAELRSSFLRKTAGIEDSDARRSTVPSGTNLAGLLQHLTFVESHWFEHVVAGKPPSRGQRSMQVPTGVSLRALRADYKAACAASDSIISAVADPAAVVAKAGKITHLRGVMLVVITETARHCGHADILREQTDGRTGR